MRRLLKHQVIAARSERQRAAGRYRRLVDHHHGRRASVRLGLVQHRHAERIAVDASQIDRVAAAVLHVEEAARRQIAGHPANPAVGDGDRLCRRRKHDR